MQKFNDARDWFLNKRFGLFIHWGIYSVGAVHEQELQRFGTSWEQYLGYMRRFDPEHFDPAQWLDLAQENGMEYLVFTTKHHDGFCMWDTRETDFNIMHTPFKKDILAMLAEECHKRKFPLELYYSIVDWHHPAYPNIGRHHEIKTDPAKHDKDRYLDFLKKQIRELCTNYGEIHGIWWDMNVAQWDEPSISAMIRELQPAALINNRGFGKGDYVTPERNYDGDPTVPFAAPTEACNSTGVNSWGYRRNEDYFTALALERQLASNMALGGNYLLNLGPKPDGSFPDEQIVLLRTLGDWYRKVSRALREPPCYGVLENKKIFCTGGGNTVNLIVTENLSSSTLYLEPLNILPEKAVLLNTGEEIEATLEHIVYRKGNPPILRLRNIPADHLNGEIPVFRLTFSDPVITGKSVVKKSTGGINADE